MRRTAKRIREGAALVDERTQFAETIKDESSLSAARKALKEVGEKPKLGKKLVKLGTVVLLSPDPISDLPGGLLLASGLALSRYGDPVSIRDIKPTLRKMLKDFETSPL
jgi:hypothetical protein